MTQPNKPLSRRKKDADGHYSLFYCDAANCSETSSVVTVDRQHLCIEHYLVHSTTTKTKAPIVSSKEVLDLPSERLAIQVFEQANGDSISAGFALTAAKELARRTLPNGIEWEGRGQQPKGNLSQGLARPSAEQKRITQMHIDSFSVGSIYENK